MFVTDLSGSIGPEVKTVINDALRKQVWMNTK